MLTESSSPCGSSKRPRAPFNLPSCLVDGCTADLRNCREYHRRHKVCGIHSKCPMVIVGGHEMRFCQQCSRFHSLEEFDEEKRSCRKRLDGHNRRRRKSQLGSPPMSSERFLYDHQGSQCMQFNDDFSSTIQLNFTEGRTLYLGSSSQDYKGQKQLPFLQGTGSTFCQTSQQLVAGSDSFYRSNRIVDLSKAHSFLSSQEHTHLFKTMSYGGGCGLEIESAMISSSSSDAINSGNNTNIHGQGMFDINRESHDGLDFGSNHRISFSLE